MRKSLSLKLILPIIATIIGTLLPSSVIVAQEMQDTVVANFGVFEMVPQEKVYLHLDKPYYGAGEKIWFKEYLVNAVSHKDDSRSNFIITELFNRSDSLVRRKKIRRDSLGVFHNAFELPADLPAGEYYLRAYTNWMQNISPEYHYSRTLKIGNSIDNTIVSEIKYQQEDETHYTAKVRFSNENQEPYVDIPVIYQFVVDGEIRNRGRIRSDEDGMISIPLQDLSSAATRSLMVQFDDKVYIYKNTFHLPNFNKDFDLAFFPEGGALLSVQRQNVAFKALGPDGLSRDISGVLIDSKGDTLSNFRSEHKGMGVFTVSNAKLDNPLHVVATSSDGITKSFDLPKVESNGFAIRMNHHNDILNYEVLKTETTEWPEKMFLIGHTRGSITLMLEINPKKVYGRISDTLFMAGISHFMLVDKNGNILSERLIFIPDREEPQWHIQSDKPKYGEREKVTLNISIKDSNGNPVKGSFSASITDHRKIHLDSLADNIKSNLLLTSDLQGYVEEPGYYFINQDVQTLRALDILMLTQGWRRYRLKNVLQPPSFDIKHYIEQGQTISGYVQGFFGGNIKKGPISVIAPKENIYAMTSTDEEGKFILNTSFPDSTRFAIQARTNRGFAEVNIYVDKQEFQPPFNKSPFINAKVDFMNDYLHDTREQYFMEGGEKVYKIKEVVVTAEKPKASEQSIYTGGLDTYSIEADKLTMFASRTAFDMTMALPGVFVNGTKITVRNSSVQPLIIIDDVIYDEDAHGLLSTLFVDDISSMSLVRGADAAIFGSRGDGGAIVITTKEGVNITNKPIWGITTYYPLGYSNAVEFYHPKYDTPQKRNNAQVDLRSTIYWNPALEFNENGETVIEYYTPDSTAPEDIIIEGVDQTGKIYRLTKTINVE